MTSPAPDTPSSPPASRLDGATRRAIAGLAATQIIGWGPTFHLPAVLGDRMGASLGLPGEVIFGGVSMMLIGGAIAAPRVGVRLDRLGGRRIMALGSIVMALALATIALAHGPLVYLAGWTIVGLAMPMALGAGAHTALAQVAGADARRAMSILLFFTGLPSFFFWPLASFLEPLLGWRATTLIFAAMHLVVCVPIHLAVLPKKAPVWRGGGGGGVAEETGLPEAARRRAFWLLAATLSFSGMISWGLALHTIGLLKALGLPAATAVFVASLSGPVQATARLGEFAFGQRASAIVTGLVAASVMPLAFVVLLLTGASTTTATLFAIFYGVSNGLMTLARATMPLALFGRRDYGAWTGKLTTPQNIMFAASPIVFAAVLSREGPVATLWLGLAVSLGAVLAVVALGSHARKSRGD